MEEAYEYDPELGFHLRSPLEIRKTTDFQHEVVTNPMGAVGFQQSFNDYPVLVFALGDSYTQGLGVPADASYPLNLDLILNTDADGRYKKKFGVVNLGTGGFGGKESLIVLSRFTSRLGKPAYILYFGADNDYEDDVVFDSGLRHKHIVANSPYWGIWARPLQWLAYQTQIGLHLRVAITERKKRALMKLKEANNLLPAEGEKPVLEQLVVYSKNNNARLILSWANAGPSYKWVQGWSAQKGIPFADWQRRVRSVAQAIPHLPMENQNSAGHYRSWVNRIIAEEFANAMGYPTSRPGE